MRIARVAWILAAMVASGSLAAASPSSMAGDDRAVHRHAPSVQGAWRLVETAVRTPGGAWDVRAAPQGGLFVFTARHYSYFYVRGAEPRARFADANRPTQAEAAATYDSFIAGAGSYTFDGRMLLLKSDFRKNPNEMNGETWPWETEVDGDTMRWVFANPPFLPGREWRVTVVRVE